MKATALKTLILAWGIILLSTGISFAQQEIVSLDVYNTASQSLVTPLSTGTSIDISDLPAFTVVAQAPSTTVKRVYFTLQGPVSKTQSEGLRPFALFGDGGTMGTLMGQAPLPGNYTLNVKAFADSAMTQLLDEETVNFAFFEGVQACHMVNSFMDLAPHGMGDANNDGAINIDDKDHILRYIAGIHDTCGASAPNNCFCDINQNGSISVQDALFLNLYLRNSQGDYRLYVRYGTGSNFYQVGEIVSIEANTPAPGQRFKEWVGGPDGAIANRFAASTTLTMPQANLTITATYEPIPPQYTLGVSTVGSGTVSLSPAGGTYDAGTQVALSALPGTGYAFDHWEGDGINGNTNSQTNITMNGNQAVVAVFVPSEPPPSGTCGNNIVEGAEVCDGTALNDQTCQSLGYAQGTLSCLEGCAGYDVSACTWDPGAGIAPYYEAINLNNYSNVVYIDPTYTGTEQGTISQPYNSWSDIAGGAQPNTAYLLKRGMTLNHGGTITVDGKNNVLFGAYGAGQERAIFIGRLNFIDNKDIIVFDIKFNGENNINNIPMGILYQKKKSTVQPDTENLLFLNNYFHGAGIVVFNWGDTACGACSAHGPIKDVKIIGNEIGHVSGDGMFIGPTGTLGANEDSSIDNLEIGYNYIHHVNNMWHVFADILSVNGPRVYNGITYNVENNSLYCPITGIAYDHCPDGNESGGQANQCASQHYIPFTCSGDAMQIADNSPLWIHHNTFDRSDTGTKFGALISSILPNKAGNALVEHNTFIGPNTEASGGTALWMRDRQGENITIRYNKFLPPHSAAVYLTNSTTEKIDVYGNILYGGSGETVNATGIKNINIFNNVFYHSLNGPDIRFAPSSNSSSSGSIANNIFMYPLDGKSVPVIYGSQGTMNIVGNNLFSSIYSGMFGGVGAYQLQPTDKIGDPLFMDAANGDFRLLASSPARNAGMSIAGYVLDRDGNAVPNASDGNITDIGAYEYTPMTLGPLGNPLYSLIVEGGSGSGYYSAGDTVTIEADPVLATQMFDQWATDQQDVTISNPDIKETTIIMPSRDAKIQATYRSVIMDEFYKRNLREEKRGDSKR